MQETENPGSAAGADQEQGTWYSGWFAWCPTSDRLLEIAESQILRKIQSYYESEFVRLENGHKIWTLKFNPRATKTPLVLVHGFGGGVGLWAMNVDNLSQNRTVYAFDVLGFGRSSRPQLSSDPEEAEEQFVDSIEQWREKLGLDKFVLLGHSLGGYLASSYTIKYPARVKHLILADPWGFPVKPSEDNIHRHIPVWVKFLGAVLSPFNPLAGLRAAGPWGPSLIRQFRPDFQRKFSSILSDDAIFNYIYHCNAQEPSGETAFKGMTIPYGWARNPMIYRITSVDRNIPMTMIYGSRSWIDSKLGQETKDRRRGCQVDVVVVAGAGHHVYVDKPEQFNELVEAVCQREDE